MCGLSSEGMGAIARGHLQAEISEEKFANSEKVVAAGERAEYRTHSVWVMEMH
jgi:hypothetical protein